MTASPAAGQRLDQWLRFARFVKTRRLAQDLASAGKLRLNGELIAKAHRAVHPGDVLTFSLGEDIRIVKVLALPQRRGPAAEARTLYLDLSPPGAKRPGEAIGA